MKRTIEVSAVHLRKEGDKVIVAVEVYGKWQDIIVELSSAPFSHICESGGILSAVERRNKEASDGN
jgi:hypothetical protein